MKLTIEHELSADEVAEVFRDEPEFFFDVLGTLHGEATADVLMQHGYSGSIHHDLGLDLLKAVVTHPLAPKGQP